MDFINYNDSSQVTATQRVVSPNIPWTGNATAFVQANQSLYGAQTVTLKMSTVITNQAGTLSGYSVTGPYQANLGRALVPWTTDDVVSGTLKFNPFSTAIGAAVGTGQLNVTPKPQLGFTAQQAANLDGFTNFNYIQRYTSTGLAAWNNILLPIGSQVAAPTIVYQHDAVGTPLITGTSDPRSVGNFDPLTTGGNSNPLIGGNPNRPADQFDPYWDQTNVVGGPPNNTVFDPATDFWLDFHDRPDLSNVGDFITFQTELVGVTMINNKSDGSTDLSYSPLTSSVDGTLGRIDHFQLDVGAIRVGSELPERERQRQLRQRVLDGRQPEFGRPLRHSVLSRLWRAFPESARRRDRHGDRRTPRLQLELCELRRRRPAPSPSRRPGPCSSSVSQALGLRATERRAPAARQSRPPTVRDTQRNRAPRARPEALIPRDESFGNSA